MPSSPPLTSPTPDEILASISAHLNRLELVFSSKTQEISTEIKAVAESITKGLADLIQPVGPSPSPSPIPDPDFQEELAAIKAQLDDLAGLVAANASLVASLSAVLQARLSALESKVEALGKQPKPEPVPEPGPEPQTPDPIPTPVPTPSTPPATPPIIASNAVVIPLVVRDTSGVDRTSGLISAGVPIAREVGLRNVGELVILDSGGWPLAGDFRATGFWEDGSIQWVQAVWVDEVKSGESKQYKLVVRSGVTNPLPVHRIDAWSSNPESVQVDTKASKEENCLFTLSPENLLDIVDFGSADGNTNIIYSGATRLKVDSKESGLSTKPRRMEIEYLGPLVCVVQVETIAETLAFGVQHDNTPGEIAITKRYEFRAGSSTVIVTQALKWEGSKNGTNWQMPDGKTPNAVLGELWADRLELSEIPKSVLIKTSGDLTDSPNAEAFAADPWIKVTQTLRNNRTERRMFTVDEDFSSRASVGGLDKGLLQVELGSFRSVVIGIKQMHFHEPCALGLNGKTLEIQHASDKDFAAKFWIPYRSGAYSTCMVAVLDGANGHDTGADECWAELNYPLRGVLADSAGYNVSEFGPLPTNAGDTDRSPYYEGIKRICESTLSNIDHFGLYGRMIYGGIPRYWGDRDGGDEVGKSEGWDGAYYFAATDYYSTSQTAVRYALITGDTKRLEDLAFPCAQRMLHTQIMQSSPDDKWIYEGWAPTGYAMYRADFNSSHSYFEGLYWYYLLTGDRQVIDILTKGQLRLIDHFKNPANPIEGRGAHQHVGAMRFLSVVHYDPAIRKTFRDAFVSLMEKAIREQYVSGTYNGEEIHLWCGGAKKKAGVNVTLNLYAQGIWDMESLWWYGKMTDSGPLFVGNPGAIHPHKILAKLAQTAMKYGAQIVDGTGKFSNLGADKWARGFKFTWDGKDGGLITNLTVAESGGETLLYKGDEPGMCAWWVRAGKVSGDAAMKSKAEELVKYAIERIRASKLPMGKVMGLGECRLGSAVAELKQP